MASTVYTNVQNFVPTNGSTIVLTDSDQDNIAIVNPIATIATLTVTMPPDPHGGQQVLIVSSTGVTAMTVTGGSTTLPNISLAAGGYVNYIYDPVNTCWMLDGVNPSAMYTQAYNAGTLYQNSFPYFSVATVSGGNATFYLTDNGLSTGNAVFKNNIFLNSLNLLSFSTTAQYQYGTPTIASGNKSITVPVTQIGLSLGIIVFTTAANGTSVILQISGN